MQFNRHTHLEGLHAAFSASQPFWLRYDDNKAVEVFYSKQAADLGTRLHAYAKDAIDLGIKQPRSKKTLYAYINDAIGFKMKTEVVLFYSMNFFGTADAILFKDNFLRIHDLKTGKGPVKREQLLVYAALFCLEYKVRPGDLKGCECRIYQNDDVDIFELTAEDIAPVMDRIIYLDKLFNNLDKED